MKLGKYRHFKGLECEVIGIAKHSETLEEHVVYKELSDNQLWVRPKTMFLETVTIDGKEIPRFTPIEETLIK